MSSAVQAVAFSGAFTGAALANDVVLKSADGSIEVSGSLLETAGENFVIRTAIGSLSVPKSRVVCDGEACPVEEAFEPNLRIGSNGKMANSLLPLAMEGFAASTSSAFNIRAGEQGSFRGKVVSENGRGDETVKFEIASVDAADAFAQVQNADLDIAFVARNAAADKFGTLGVNAEPAKHLGYEALSIIVHPDNPVSEIGMQELRNVLRGTITNWRELGGPDADIRLVRKASDTQTGSMLQDLLFVNEAAFIDAATDAETTEEEMAILVSQDPTAIGLVGVSEMRGTKPLGVTYQCGVTSYPSAFSAKSGDYPLTRPVYALFGDAAENEHREAFMEYASTDEFEYFVQKSGLVGTSILRASNALELMNIDRRIDLAKDSYELDALELFKTELEGHVRLSTTFRFWAGTSNLDENGQSDMKELVEYLSNLPEGTTVTLVGFSDSIGASESNRFLSLKRAEHVEGILRQIMPDASTQVSFHS